MAAVKEVWAENMLEELPLILEASRSFPYVALDTEFPGFLHQTPRFASPDHRYRDIKHNVDAMKLIQLGLSFFGRGSGGRRTWQINFRDFDVSSPADARSEASVELLRSSGIDLERTQREGVDSHRLSELLKQSGWVDAAAGSARRPSWVTFAGAYDVAYLMKLLTRAPLPDSLSGFTQLVGQTLGSVFDAKYAARFCHGLQDGHLGLARLSEILDVKVDGTAAYHQAGHDSLLTGMAFERMVGRFHLSEDVLEGFLCGIEQEKIVKQRKGPEMEEGRPAVSVALALEGTMDTRREGRHGIEQEEMTSLRREYGGFEIEDAPEEMMVTVICDQPPLFYPRLLHGFVGLPAVPVMVMQPPPCGCHCYWG